MDVDGVLTGEGEVGVESGGGGGGGREGEVEGEGEGEDQGSLALSAQRGDLPVTTYNSADRTSPPSENIK